MGDGGIKRFGDLQAFYTDYFDVLSEQIFNPAMVDLQALEEKLVTSIAAPEKALTSKKVLELTGQLHQVKRVQANLRSRFKYIQDRVKAKTKVR